MKELISCYYRLRGNFLKEPEINGRKEQKLMNIVIIPWSCKSEHFSLEDKYEKQDKMLLGCIHETAGNRTD